MYRLAPILLLTCSLVVSAEDSAPNLELRKAECPNVAKTAGYAYYAKKEEGRVLAVSDANRATGLAPLYQWSIDYATERATGPDDAVHWAIEKCLRNVESIKAAASRGEPFRLENLK